MEVWVTLYSLLKSAIIACLQWLENQYQGVLVMLLMFRKLSHCHAVCRSLKSGIKAVFSTSFKHLYAFNCIALTWVTRSL